MNFIYSIFIIILIDLSLTEEIKSKKYILLPFSVNKNFIEKEISNSDDFIRNNFINDIILYLNIGEPLQKLNGIISNDNLCFELKDINNISKNISEKYIPKYSSSFSVFNKPLYFPHRETEYMTIGTDLFSFENQKYNLSFLLQQTNEKEINHTNISNKQYIAKIGLNIPMYYYRDECPNFIMEIKRKAFIDKYTVSFQFINSNNGYLVIGDELYNYNHKIYHKSQYINSYSNDNYIYFNDIIISDNNIKNISFNSTYSYLEFNLGVIIGTKEYKKEIDNIFFNKLISDKICQIDIIVYNSTHNYSVYNCIENKINLKLFPKLIFISKNYLYNFELNYSDLFIKKNSKYYFIIIFKANNIKTSIKDSWLLGQPFYKKYNFTLNLDANMIGFYNPNIPIKDEEIEKDNNEKENIEEKNNLLKKIIFIILIIIFVIVLLILTFYLGMKMKEGRKKRANELKDDDYIYTEKNEKNENEKNNLLIN